MFGVSLNASINRYGQDLKNKQWLIEPLANIAISLCTMDTCYKRYRELDEGDHKKNTFEVLSLSVSNHYKNTIENGKEILAYIDSKNNNFEMMNAFRVWEERLNYSPDIYLYSIPECTCPDRINTASGTSNLFVTILNK